MSNIIIYCILSFCLGSAFTLIFTKYIKINISFKQNEQQNIKLPAKELTNPKIKAINSMLTEIRQKGQLPIGLSGTILMSLKEIANTPDWDSKIDNETVENLYKIYQRWQKHLTAKPAKAVKIAGAGGFHQQKYWEGTQEEYYQACQNGQIDKYTDVHIIEYTGESLEMDENGEIEEYME